jgi:bifunctional ADP-heptose synthase (sugar kinase/adenylyltransferase)
VILFDEDTPKELIEFVAPDVLVKGGDYTEETIVGADVVKAKGGEVVAIPLVEGYSTSIILNSKF